MSSIEMTDNVRKSWAEFELLSDDEEIDWMMNQITTIRKIYLVIYCLGQQQTAKTSE